MLQDKFVGLINVIEKGKQMNAIFPNDPLDDTRRRPAQGAAFWLWLACGCVLQMAPAMAQPGSLDMSFDPGDALQGPNVDVRALALHDGGILVGGDFNHFCQMAAPKAVDGIIGWQCHSILKLKREGSVDPSFNAGVGANGPVNALTATGEPAFMPHTIYLGGEFSRMLGVERNGVARLLPNGFLDTAFRPINQPDDIVYALAFHPYANYGQILVGGELSGTGARGVLRLNRDGTADTFWPRLSEDDVVNALVVEPESSTILVGGELEVQPGVARLRWDGSEDPRFQPGTSDGDTVYAIALHSWNGEMGILLGGEFENYPGLVRLHWDGSVDETFMRNLNEGMDGAVMAILVQPNGSIVIGGEFATANRHQRKGVARLLPSGAVDTGFQPGAGTQDGDVHALAFDAFGQILIGGSFTRVDGFTRRGVARLNGDQAPNLLQGPFAFTLYEGQRATNWVEVASAIQPTAFQWFKDRIRLVDNGRIRGCQSSRLALAPALVPDTGSYNVLVGNPAGMVLSRAALLRVLPLPNQSNTSIQPASNPALAGTNK
jgi:uncharacterized delta-60 repeat protein